MDATRILHVLLDQPGETEVLEFKEAKEDFDSRELKKYFSALSNEANLKGKTEAWLVFGVSDSRKIVGTRYRNDPAKLESLKHDVSVNITNNISFKEIYEIDCDAGRVLLFEIPAAPRGIPVGFNGHYYARQGESLVALDIGKIERIRGQGIYEDWSAAIIEEAGIDDLNSDAIGAARENYKKKFPEQANDVSIWSDSVFLNKAKVTIKGKITRAALLLLGKETSAHYLLPTDASIRWVLRDHKNIEKDYEHFGLPLILSVSKVLKKIRVLKYRYIADGTLFPEEIDNYDPYVIREALHNCIAHQDYSLAGKINVIEYDDRLVFTNKGSFVPGSIETVIIQDAPEEHNRNRFLTNAMLNLDMVDIIGSGIRKMFTVQSARFFPLPDYDLSENRVSVTIAGKVLDLDYARLLARTSELSLVEIMALDKLQKKRRLSEAEVNLLRNRRLIEGRKPNYYIAKSLAQKTGQKATYSLNRGLDKQYYFDLVSRAAREHGSISRKVIDELLWKKLPDWMSEKQRKGKVSNIIKEMSRKGLIENRGSKSNSSWVCQKELG